MRMTPRALILAERMAREAAPEMQGPWPEWAGDRDPGTLPERDAEGYVEVPDAVAGAFLGILEAEIERTRPARNEALLAKAVVAVLRQRLDPGAPAGGA